MTYKDLLTAGIDALNQSGVGEAGLNAWHLFHHVSGIERAGYFLKQDEAAPEDICEAYRKLIEERCIHRPLEHILGIQEFMGLRFFVNEHVLIPRQDTETLVELVLEDMKKMTFQKPLRLLDICAGTGCIGLSIARFLDISVTGADISREALAVATKNAESLGVKKADFICSDMFRDIPKERYDIITANPPYIPSNVCERLMPEVRDFEPRLALDGHEDGLHFYRILAEQCRDYLSDTGVVYMEIGHDQSEPVSELMRMAGYKDITVSCDITGNTRVVRMRREQTDV